MLQVLSLLLSVGKTLMYCTSVLTLPHLGAFTMPLFSNPAPFTVTELPHLQCVMSHVCAKMTCGIIKCDKCLVSVSVILWL